MWTERGAGDSCPLEEGQKSRIDIEDSHVTSEFNPAKRQTKITSAVLGFTKNRSPCALAVLQVKLQHWCLYVAMKASFVPVVFYVLSMPDRFGR